MATFVLIHGGGDSGWAWHLLEAELRTRGHETVAPDLPSDQPSAGLGDYADAVVEAVGERRNLVVVGHSYGAFTAPLVADRLPVDVLVLLAGMIPAPGERPDDWWETTGCVQARDAAGLSAIEDPSRASTTMFRASWPRSPCAGSGRSPPGRAASRGRWRPGRTRPRSSSCARTTASSRPSSSAA
ncbi:alpha/beta fold hydrolase [Streptomyces lasiicapitis]|uniref:alpha/beta fold hydrolase n=1 Tax=Streptomyces lasiicapitis TaxID=1923961 RepID=UPI0036692C78